MWHEHLSWEIGAMFKALMITPMRFSSPDWGGYDYLLIRVARTSESEYRYDKVSGRVTGDPVERCHRCGGKMPGLRGKGSHRKFCNPECHRRWHNERISKLRKSKPKKLIKCKICFKEVISAPNKKFCSKKCKRINEQRTNHHASQTPDCHPEV